MQLYQMIWEQRFSVTDQEGQDTAITVDPISANLPGSHTVGFVEVRAALIVYRSLAGPLRINVSFPVI